MTTTQMKYFIVAATCLNFTEAANSLYLSPSSLSRQITAMERELNVQLFLRDNRSVRLTPAGKALLEDWAQVYDSYLLSVARAQEIQRGQLATLNIGILDGHVISGQFPQIIRQMELQHPNVAINLFRGSFGDLTQALYNETADLIITLEFSLRGKEQINCLPLSRTHDYLAVLRSSPLAAKRELTAQDIGNEVFIEISEEDSPYSHELTKDVVRSCGCGVKSASNLETCTLWVQAGLGFAVINSHNYLASDPKLCFIDLDEIPVEGLSPLDSDLVLSWHTANLNPALPVFLNVCQDYMNVSPPPIPSNRKQ